MSCFFSIFCYLVVLGPSYSVEVLEIGANQQELSESNATWEITNNSLIGNDLDSVTIYVRNESVRLWSELESSNITNTRMIIQGSPGIGKSTELYGWVLFKRRSCKVLYVA